MDYSMLARPCKNEIEFLAQAWTEGLFFSHRRDNGERCKQTNCVRLVKPMRWASMASLTPRKRTSFWLRRPHAKGIGQWQKTGSSLPIIICALILLLMTLK